MQSSWPSVKLSRHVLRWLRMVRRVPKRRRAKGQGRVNRCNRYVVHAQACCHKQRQINDRRTRPHAGRHHHHGRGVPRCHVESGHRPRLSIGSRHQCIQWACLSASRHTGTCSSFPMSAACNVLCCSKKCCLSQMSRALLVEEKLEFSQRSNLNLRPIGLERNRRFRTKK